jgi:diguanylate cyclase (GGDEF)-like protein
LEFLARTDALTGLANRRTFDEILAKEHRRAKRDKRPLGLIMIDVDRFKSFNDLYGHPKGDDCLRRIGKTIANSLYRAGDLAARYGGEEFVALFPDTDELGAAIIGERIREAVFSLAIEHGSNDRGVVTISVGAYSDGPDEFLGEAESVLEADRALYRAKKEGRNRVVLASRLSEAPIGDSSGDEEEVE